MNSEQRLLLSSALGPDNPIRDCTDPYDLRKSFELVQRNVVVHGFELYIIEQWLTDRTFGNPTLLVSAAPTDEVLVDVYRLRPIQHPGGSKSTLVDQRWKEIIERIPELDGSRPQQTPLGTLFVRPLSAVRNDRFNLIKIEPSPDPTGPGTLSYKSIKEKLFCNINLRRMGFTPRTGLDLLPPSSSQRKKFLRTFLLPDHLETDDTEFRQLVLTLVNLIQAALHLFGMGPMRHETISELMAPKQCSDREDEENRSPPKDKRKFFSPKNSGPPSTKPKPGYRHFIGLDGLLCDSTLEGLIKWRQQFDWSDEIPESPVLNSSLLASIISTILWAEHRLIAETSKEISRKLSDPFRHPRSFLKAWVNFQMANELEPEPFLSFYGLQELIETSVSGSSPAQRRRFPRPKGFGRGTESSSYAMKPSTNLGSVLRHLSELSPSTLEKFHNLHHPSSDSSLSLDPPLHYEPHTLQIHSLHRLWFPSRSSGDDEPERARFLTHLPDSHDHTVAGSGKTFLKPFVKGVASAGRSVGAGIYHAGKVVDAITDLTERISAPRNTGSPNLLAASTSEFGPVMEASEVVPEERREKAKRFKGPFKKGTGNYGPGNSSDAGSEGYVPRAGLPRLDSLELSRDEFPHLGSRISRKRYSRAHTDHIGISKCDDEEPEVMNNNSDDETNGTTDRAAAIYNYEAVFPKARNQSISKMAFAKRRHSIQIPQDYNLVTVRHSTRKQNLEVQLVWNYRMLKKMEQRQRAVLEAFEVLEALYHSTAKEAEIKSREVKDRLEGYVEQNKIASELLSFLPSDPLPPNRSTALSGPSSANPSGNFQYQQRQLSVSNRSFSWDKVDPQTWELYKQLTSTGEVLRQRRHEVSNKRRMMEHHVDELIMQAGLKRPVHSRDHSSRPRQLKDSGLDASDTGNADHKQRKGTSCRKEKRKLKLVTEIEQDSQADEHDDEEGADSEGRRPSSGDSKVVIAMAEEVISSIERDPSLQIAEFIELVILGGLARLLGTLGSQLGSIFRNALRSVLVFFVRQIHRLAACLDIDEHEHQLRNPHSELRTRRTRPPTSQKEDHPDGQDQLAQE
ncbi:hypothetical protein MJO28_008553 [Puccinia striiformis f. sp. tritici]|uniref:Uncharacterized protein n=1 Tax=Puccinia striiformis f. sp. tritici TaxID=168172 RepID=A0ACC0EBC2_9BASI|nr:hypothetical protein Pst134EA_015372 [Puccinia striiformis f. sp. tritici]KAH9463288.1 hypothetical protein Pst134EA_015372 [Puccinia striiformis f. sp. tritici]KAI7949732.1 hypothetical protein MJO28_008553 [Puccinia striiformis f. sp. tritici]